MYWFTERWMNYKYYMSVNQWQSSMDASKVTEGH